MTPKLSITIIGVGRLGGALALALSKKGYEINSLVSGGSENALKIADSIEPKPRILSSKEFNKISSDLIFITVPDPEIQQIAGKLADALPSRSFVFHLSGALSSDILQDLTANGRPSASLHPLVSISDSQIGATKFKGAFFCIEGNSEAVQAAEKIVADLEGNSFTIPTKFKPLYHASAVTASGHLVALFSTAIEMLAACGLANDAAREILFPLVKSTVENLSLQTPAQALTGTFARADVPTLRSHLTALRENVPTELVNVYLQLGLRSLHLAQEQGANKENLDRMREILINVGKGSQ